jgi:hypothetical protein
MAKFSSYLPVRHMIVAVYDASIAEKGVSSWPWHDFFVMAIWGVGAVLVAARRWSWAPRQATRGHARSFSSFGMMGRRQQGESGRFMTVHMRTFVRFRGAARQHRHRERFALAFAGSIPVAACSPDLPAELTRSDRAICSREAKSQSLERASVESSFLFER